ncbi:class I SAM-dependent methyltransferase [Streptomyces sp. NPDC091292]|uniref:class I SAM-dependent methyltransferase n=1 Tax=Streptomyces sp. NPDC091292 TaxID=3365991 RepID=UPI00382F0C1E
MTAIDANAQARVWNGSVGAQWAGQQERMDRMLAGLNEPLFRAAAIGEGDQVLDVGCGAGATTRIAAGLASRGNVLGADVSAPLLERAAALTGAEGIRNVTYARVDAQSYPFRAGAYDVVISRGGVMFFADHAAAFRNLARALRPGGRLVFVCPLPHGADVEESRVMAAFGARLRETGAGAGPSADRMAAMTAMASLSDPDRVRAVLGGYEDVTVDSEAVDTVWGRDAADTVGFLLSQQSAQEVPSPARAALEDVFRPYETPDGVRLRSGVWLVTAVRPR